MIRKIQHWYTDRVLWEGEADTVKDALHAAIASGADLRDANLRDADLTGADLRGANLRDAIASGANLRGANLRDANLRDADLTGADLRGANLRDAIASGANLRDANLTGADLTPIRDDIFAVLSSAPAEAQAVLDALRAGKVDGSCYEGACACLVGTIANARHCSYIAVPGLQPSANRPAERFFTLIKPGDTPENNAAAKLAAEWIDGWIQRMQSAFGATTEVR